MSAVVRIGDVNSEGGSALQPRPTVLASGRPLAAFGSRVAAHPCCGVDGCEIHCAASIAPSFNTVFAAGTPVHVVGNVDTCGHPRASGDFTVLALGGGMGGGL